MVVVGTFVYALSNTGVRESNVVEDIPFEPQRTQSEAAIANLFEGGPKTYADLTPRQDPKPEPELAPDIDYDTDETTIDYGFERSDNHEPQVEVYQGPSAEEIAAEEARLAAQKRAWESPIAFDLGPDFAARNRSSLNAPTLPDLSALQNAGGTEQSQLPQLSLTAEGNDPARKLQFDEQNFSGETHVGNPYLTPASFGHEIKAGTTIAASLITGINSDLPGTIVAHVTRPIYDSLSGRTLLVPQGSRLLGRYDAIISFDQERVQVAWHRLILPNGGSIQLDNMPGIDRAGYAGISGDVDNHLDSVATGIGISTTISGLASLLTNSTGGNGDAVDASVQAIQGQSSAVSNSITERYLNRQPTITVEPGTPVFLLLTKDLQLPTYERS
ncbi:hypothetical protein CYMTET_5824 [Cymbomonas tetramitiformis]|uniref:Conjugal transfer protein TrbI n=1 Tax=Cymbomonas tetramitiformis TaxID=36881 RepID=A0AAE0GYP9_9CHLO|nr:hypothetical protein CYMTET_5824 [Cymbomonas tetramitiformis]